MFGWGSSDAPPKDTVLHEEEPEPPPRKRLKLEPETGSEKMWTVGQELKMNLVVEPQPEMIGRMVHRVTPSSAIPKVSVHHLKESLTGKYVSIKPMQNCVPSNDRLSAHAESSHEVESSATKTHEAIQNRVQYT